MWTPLLGAASALYGVGWELRRRLYARGTFRPERVGARVVSVGNMTVGGTGKTTLTLHLAHRLARAARPFAVVCRRYRPGPEGVADEEMLYVEAFGRERVYAGASKLALARNAARDGRSVILVDDGFSHWPLARDVNLVMLDARDPWGGGRLLPAGRLREPHRALQRADAVILTRVDDGQAGAAALAAVARHAPAALLAAGRHRVIGVRPLGAEPAPGAEARVWIVTATGNPRAVVLSAMEAGLAVAGCSRYRDHHWFRPHEVKRELARARAAHAAVLVTPKDAVRWPRQAGSGVLVLEVEWEWVAGGAAIERMVENAE
jgi:tetraacyldisaccharide 4'-kinase